MPGQPDRQSLHVDAIMTEFSRLYANEQGYFIADKAFPAVRVGKQSDKYFIYNASHMFRNEAQRREPGAPYPESGWTVSTDSFFCDAYALAHAIADEDVSLADAPLDLDRDTAEWLAHKALIHRERAFSAGFMITGVWGTDDNNSATDWDSTGTPITNVQTAQRTVQTATGMIPNTLVCGLIVLHALQTNAQIVDLIKYSERALPTDVSESVIAQALGLSQVLVSKASYESADEGETSSMAAIVDDDALVVYVSPRPGIRSASGGLTYFWEGGGGLGQVTRVRDDLRDSDMARIKFSYDQKLIGSTLGYFFADIV